MTLNLDTILKTMALIGADTPAYLELLAEITAMFGEKDQQKLQETYEALQGSNDALHTRLQAKLKAAGGSADE